jgi:hypothetical protein
MSALPNPAGLKYFDNSNNTPAPQGVQVAFNQESQDVWIGYDAATSQVCITNYNRTLTLACFFPGGSLLFNSTADKVVVANGVQSILPTTGVGSSIIPANFLKDGTKLSVKIGGTLFAPVGANVGWGATYLLRLKVGGAVVVLSAIYNLVFADNETLGFSADLELTYRASGTIITGTGKYNLGNVIGYFVPDAVAAVVNPAVANQVDIEKDWLGLTTTVKIMSIESPK